MTRDEEGQAPQTEEGRQLEQVPLKHRAARKEVEETTGPPITIAELPILKADLVGDFSQTALAPKLGMPKP